MCFPFSLLVPSSVPHPVSSSSYESPHKITFSWQPLLQSEINGQLLGYKVQYQMVAVGGELVTDSESLTEMVPPDENVFLLSNQSVYTSFRFKVAAVTTAGEGNFSEEVTGGITVSIVTLLTIFFFFLRWHLGNYKLSCAIYERACACGVAARCSLTNLFSALLYTT